MIEQHVAAFPNVKNKEILLNYFGLVALAICRWLVKKSTL